MDAERSCNNCAYRKNLEHCNQLALCEDWIRDTGFKALVVDSVSMHNYTPISTKFHDTTKQMLAQAEMEQKRQRSNQMLLERYGIQAPGHDPNDPDDFERLENLFRKNGNPLTKVVSIKCYCLVCKYCKNGKLNYATGTYCVLECRVPCDAMYYKETSK